MKTNKFVRQRFAVPVLVLVLFTATARSDQQIVPEDGALRAALATGGVITFTRGGALNVRQPLIVERDVMLDATAAPVVISGANASRVIHVMPGVSLTLVNVTIANGRAPHGAGLLNEGTVTLENCIFTDNIARGADAASGNGAGGENAAGGAIYNAGVLTMTGTAFNGNRAEAGSGGNGAPGWNGYGAAGSGGHAGHGADAAGGAIYSSGTFFASNCTFNVNSAIAGTGGAGGAGGTEQSGSGARGGAGGHGGNGGHATGGALFLAGDSTLTSVSCLDNEAIGGKGGAAGASGGDAAGIASGDAGRPGIGGSAGGGAIFLDGATVQISLAALTGNRLQAGSGGQSMRATPAVSTGLNGNGAAGGEAAGAAIHISRGSAMVEFSSLSRNTAEGGQGTPGSDSFNQPGARFLPAAGGIGGSGGSAQGALFNAGNLLVTRSTINGNAMRGGNGGVGGNGGSARTARGSAGGHAGDGGLASGGGLCNRGAATIINCTIVDNECQGGIGANGGISGQARFAGENVRGGNGGLGGLAAGAAICSDGMGNTVIDFVTMANNSVFSGRGGKGGKGSSSSGAAPVNGIDAVDGRAEGANFVTLTSGTIEIRNSISLLSGSGVGAVSHGAGNVVDLGFNVCSGNSCGFTEASSFHDTDPMLGPLSDNGGSTLTMALQRGSPCADSAEAAGAPDTDQRGFSRPAGGGYDIGAFEADAALAPSPGAPVDGFVVRGRVLENGLGLANIKVKLGRRIVYTDENGEFLFVLKKKGRYAVRPIERRVRFAPQVQRVRVRDDVVLADFTVRRRR